MTGGQECGAHERAQEERIEDNYVDLLHCRDTLARGQLGERLQDKRGEGKKTPPTEFSTRRDTTGASMLGIRRAGGAPCLNASTQS
jgi:hypothetical protein